MHTDDEDIVLNSQGTIKGRSTWQIGQLFLTEKRLYFKQTRKYLFEINLDKIVKITIEKRIWLLGCRVKQLCINYYSKNGNEKVYIALAEPERWVPLVKNTMARMLIERCGHNGSKPESTSDTQ
jgi:hypothetical protein